MTRGDPPTPTLLAAPASTIDIITNNNESHRPQIGISALAAGAGDACIDESKRSKRSEHETGSGKAETITTTTTVHLHHVRNDDDDDADASREERSDREVNKKSGDDRVEIVKMKKVDGAGTGAGGDSDNGISGNNGDSSATVIDTVAMENRVDMELMCWSDMPRHLQFNPHIISGYRPLMKPAECLASIFRVHNETVNILTHGFAIVYILVTVPFMLPWGSRGPLSGFLSWCHLLGAVSPWIGSFLYHVFMNLEYGEGVYRSLLKLDMLGIWICQSFGAMPLIAASVHCLSDIPWHLCISTYCFLSIWGLFKAMNASSPWERRLCFSPLFMMRMLVVAFRSLGLSGGDPEAFHHVVLQDLVAVVGGTIGAMRVPEKWMPGRLDLLFNSHNIMHVMVVMAVHSMHSATVQDLAWMSQPGACTISGVGPSSSVTGAQREDL